ncbi:hypothetical protein BpHYR1_036054 [Brachionus plicatilis]|uniref:Uncharacterized protein n=1 Tax=Brachionus plicatilis TaxID=10195 RepID=A0A3M7RZH5_BRAPC|nr:hypothetical protein BpHYR1_036054 [Brachionus plicatilis]
MKKIKILLHKPKILNKQINPMEFSQVLIWLKKIDFLKIELYFSAHAGPPSIKWKILLDLMLLDFKLILIQKLIKKTVHTRLYFNAALKEVLFNFINDKENSK